MLAVTLSIAPAAHAATLTLNPTGNDAARSSANWTMGAGAWATGLRSNDGNTSYATCSQKTSNLYLTLDPTSGQSGAITSVQITAIALTPDGASLALGSSVGSAGTTVLATSHSPTTSYATYSDTFTTNPSGATWSWADIANLRAVVSTNGGPNNRTLNVTQVYVTVTYAAQYAVVSSAGSGGSISPLGTTNVNEGGSQAYSITPNTGYHVADVLVDGVSAGAVTSYTFTNVTAAHTIGPPLR